MESDVERVTRILASYLPHSEITRPNPVFNFDLRRVRWLSDPERLLRFSLYLFLIPPVAISLIVFVLAQDALHAGANSYAYRAYYQFFFVTTWVIFLLSLAVTVVGDLYYLLVSVSSINRMITSGEWDMLRLTVIPETDLVQSKHVVAEIKGWRFMVIEAAVRTFGLGFAITHMVLFAKFSYAQLASPLFLAALSAVLVIWSGIYAIEPLWRMRALTALGIAASAEIHRLTYAGLAALAGSAGMHLLQGGMVLAGTWIATGIFAISVALDRAMHKGGPGTEIFFTPLAAVLVSLVCGFLIRQFYHRIYQALLNRAMRTAFKSE